MRSMRRIIVLFIMLLVLMSINPTIAQSDLIQPIAFLPSADSVSVRSTSDIQIVFDHPVVALSSTAERNQLASPIEISPSLAGRGEWLNTFVYRFEPSEPLKTNTRYEVQVRDNITAEDGRQLGPAEWAFQTRLASVTFVDKQYDSRYRGDELLLDNGIWIRFNQPVESDIIESLIQFVAPNGDPVDGTFEWPNDAFGLSLYEELYFNPTDNLSVATDYQLIVTPTYEGRRIFEEANKTTFTTIPAPYVSAVYPEDGAYITPRRYNTAEIHFGTPMNMDTVRDRIRIAPEDTVMEMRTTTSSQSIDIYFDREFDVEYMVTLLAGAEDIYGNIIEEDFSWSFSFKETAPSGFAQLLTNGSFNLLSSERSPTQMAMRVGGAVDVTRYFELYTVTPEDLAEADVTQFRWQQPDRSERLPADIETDEIRYPFDNVSNLIREWEETFNGGGEIIDTPLILGPDDTDGQLTQGLYWLVNRYEPNTVGNHLLIAVADLNLTIKRTDNQIMVMVTALDTGEPVGGIPVYAYHDGRVAESSISNSDGIAYLPIENRMEDEFNLYGFRTYDYLLITAESADHFGAWYTNSFPQPETQRGYIYTDRPLYRPGETVYFRGILREKDDMRYEPSTANEVTVTLCSYYNCYDDEVTSQVVPVSYFGTFNGSFELPESVVGFTYFLKVDWGDDAFTSLECSGSRWYSWCYPGRSNRIQITIASYDIPSYEVHAHAQTDDVVAGDEYRVQAIAEYYSGGGVQSAEATWEWTERRGRFNYENYHFMPASPADGYSSGRLSLPSQEEDDPPLLTDADGVVIWSGTASEVDPEYPIPTQVQFDVTLRRTGESRTARTNFIVHPSSVYVGQRTDRRILEPGEEVSIEFVTVAPSKQIVPDHPLTITIEHIKWERVYAGYFGQYDWERKVTVEQVVSLSTGEDGLASFQFMPETNGSYRIHVEAIDAEGRVHRSTGSAYVSGARYGYVSSYDARYGGDNRLSIFAENNIYEPGDTARLLIPAPYAGTILITVERDDIMRTRVISVEEGDFIHELPIIPEYAPNVYVSATFTGVDETGYPQLLTAHTELKVDPRNRRLQVEVTPSDENPQPGDTVTFDVRVTDYFGVPIRAEVGLALVDEAVLSLHEANSLSLEDVFYERQQHNVYNWYGLDGLVDDITDSAIEPSLGGGGGGGDNFEGMDISIEPRENFITTPLWAPAVITDETGRATVEVIMPDNLTRWRLDARVVSFDTLVGQYETNLVSSLPFTVRPTAPRFLLADDEFTLSAVVQNNTDEQQTVDVWLETTGLVINEDLRQTVTIDAGHQIIVTWGAVTQATDAVEVTVYAANDAVQDAAQPERHPIPVTVYTTRDTTATGGVLDSAETFTETIRIPDNAIDGTLDIDLVASLTQTTLDAVESVPYMESETTTTTVSRLLLNLSALDLVANDPVQREVLTMQINTDVERVVDLYVSADIGWTWRREIITKYPQLSAFALMALTQARALGFTADGMDEVIAGRCEKFDRVFNNWTNNVPEDKLDERAVMLYEGSFCEPAYDTVTTITALWEREGELRTSSRAYLLLVLNCLDPEHPLIPVMVDQLLGSASASANGLHWIEDDDTPWRNSVRTTALTIHALLAVGSDDPLIPAAVRWLVIAREGTRWVSPLTLAQTVITLTEYTQQRYTSPNYTYTVNRGETTLAEGVVGTATYDQSLSIPFAQGEMGQVSITRGDGDGSLYYTAILGLRIPVEQTPPINEGVFIMREYLDAEGNPISSITLSENVYIRLTFGVDESVYFFQLEDFLPAGLVADNPRLLNINRASSSTISRGLNSDNPRWFWGYSYISQAAYLDDRVILWADRLPAGIYSFTYVARPTTPGTFQTRPPLAYSEAMPDIFGRGIGQIFQVQGN